MVMVEVMILGFCINSGTQATFLEVPRLFAYYAIIYQTSEQHFMKLQQLFGTTPHILIIWLDMFLSQNLLCPIKGCMCKIDNQNERPHNTPSYQDL